MSQCSRELYQWEVQRLLVTPKPPLDIFLDAVRVLVCLNVPESYISERFNIC